MSPLELEVTVILPTYNEAENIPVIVPAICAVLEKACIRGEVLVVDDNSPDQTGSIARSLADKHPVRALIRENERGLATAVMAGFKQARGRVVVVMDADGSHPVDKIPDLVRPLLEDRADITVGSRYVQGGMISQWPWHRKLISKTAALMTTGLSRMSDPTTGFMAAKRELVLGLTLNPVGWKIVLEVVVKAGKIRLVEVPITFCDRKLGRSKMSVKQQGIYLRHLFRLYRFKYTKLVEFFLFCLVGFTGLFVDMGAVISLKELVGLDTRVCAVFGFLLAVTSNFMLNRYLTFERGQEAKFIKSYLIFLAVCSIGLMTRLGVMHVLIVYAQMDVGRWYILNNFIGVVVATLVNFVGTKLFVFSAKS